MENKNKKQPPLKELILSDEFKNILKNILNKGKSKIASKILEFEGKDSSITYITKINNSDDGVSFVQSGRLLRLDNLGEDYDAWTMRGRVDTTIGRLIRRLFGTKFNQESVERFVNKYKAIIRMQNSFKNFDIVQGDDIKYWYLQSRYEARRGVLGGSCMQYQECQNYFGIYTKNPEHVRLCILKNDKGDKIKGRAIVWKLTQPDMVFMDRIYTIEDADVNLFKEFAKQNGWVIKKRQTYRDDILLYPDGKEEETPKLIVELNNNNFNRYPYMDTMRIFYRNKKILSNKVLSTKKYGGRYITLNDTGGYYNEYNDDDYEDVFVTDWRGNEINENDAVWCEYDDVYCLSTEATRVRKGENGRGKFFIPNSPFLKFSEYSLSYYHKDDVIYSKHLKDWIYKKYAVKVYYDIDKNKWEWSHKLTNHHQIGKINDDYYIIDLLYRDQIEDKNGNITLGDYHFKDEDFLKLPIEPEDDDYFSDVPDGLELDK